MPTLKIPTPLRSYTNGQAEVAVGGSSVAQAMDNLIVEFPTLKPHLYNGDGNLRPFVNLFVGENNIRDLQGLDTPLTENARVILIPSIAGGSGVPEMKKEQNPNHQARQVHNEEPIKPGALRGSFLILSQHCAGVVKNRVGD